MSEALLLSLIHKLDINYRENDSLSKKDYSIYNVWETDKKEGMERVIKEMREIVDIVRDKKLEEGRSLNFLVSDLVDMADDALEFRYREYYESIHSWIGEIKKQMVKLGDDGAEMESKMRSSENVDEEDVVGLEEDVEMLLHKRIICRYKWIVLIKGMAGIGKTTLAREIYNHTSVVQHFEHRAWVSNSTDLTIKELLIKVIQQVEDPHISSLLENMDNRSLRDMLSQHLRGKRYLIVLDDMPKQMSLRFLKAFPQEGNGSRLLLTSHTTHTDINVYDEDVHKVKPLDPKKSWLLFLKTINRDNKLMGEHKFPTSLEYMGKQMLRKCGGLPLAIKEVGKQLAEKKVSEGSEWEQLLESVDFSSTLKLLEPFYHQLDPELKLCFMSMSFFKENTTLRAEKLTQIWLAGGVVQGSEYECEKYIDRLINESVIDCEGKSTKYHMSVVLHMLSIQKAEEKLGFEILRNNGNNRPSESPRHHRVIICSRDKFNYSTDQDKLLVSLFFHGGGYLDTSPSYWKSFDQLKILDLEDFGLKFLPETIGRLMELKYLGLRNNYIKELPESLGCLEKLEVLDIAQNFLVEVPDVIWEMDSLLHLYMSDVICRKPLNLNVLWKLNTLTYVSIDNWTYSSLETFSCLNKLVIEELDENSDGSSIILPLGHLMYLRHLILRGYRFRSMPYLGSLYCLDNVRTLKLDGLLPELPYSLPPNIESLTLIDSCLDEDPMPLLAARAPKLKYLKLRNAYTGQQMVILVNSFPRLEVLCIKELWNLKKICGKDGMHSLKKLEIHNCPCLDTLHEATGLFSYIKVLKVVTTKSIATKIKNSEYLISNIVMVNINP